MSISGNPGAVNAAAAHAAGTSGFIDSAGALLSGITADALSGWSGGAVAPFAHTAAAVTEIMNQAGQAMNAGSAAMRTYANELEQLQSQWNQADGLLQHAETKLAAAQQKLQAEQTAFAAAQTAYAIVAAAASSGGVPKPAAPAQPAGIGHLQAEITALQTEIAQLKKRLATLDDDAKQAEVKFVGAMGAAAGLWPASAVTGGGGGITIPQGTTTFTGIASWFNGAPTATGASATTDVGVSIRQPGTTFDAAANRNDLNGYWLVSVPGGKSMVLKQIDLGPNQSVGPNRTIDLTQPAQQAFARAGAGFNGTQPGVHATYLGKSGKWQKYYGKVIPTPK